MNTEDEVLFEEKNGTGVITLNRPKVLNALTVNMFQQMNKKMTAWATDPAIKAVVIKGAGARAFCAGGDIKAVAQEALAMREGKSDGALTRDIFREEYILNHMIFTYPKPYVSLIRGIVMGGGMGLSAHGRYRVVTEDVTFAMPETAIGFFPDVGGGHFLSRCPGETGTYIGLTGKRIGLADVFYCGFATHYVPVSGLPLLEEHILKAPEKIEDILSALPKPPDHPSDLATHRAEIDGCFAYDDVEKIVFALQKDASEWAKETLKVLESVSPTSLKVTLRQIRLAKNMDFKDVMRMEYRISQACVNAPDFYEGVRAALIDKDRQPKWSPVANDVSSFFQNLGDKELVLG